MVIISFKIEVGDFMLVEYPNTSVSAIFNDNSFTDLNIVSY